MVKKILGIAILPVMMFAFVGCGGTVTDQPSGNESDAEENVYQDPEYDVLFEISGTNFAFSKTELKVKEGQTVKITFKSDEGFHDWVVDEFNANTLKVNPGEKTSITFVANQIGTFEYYCSVGDHRAKGMVGNLIVE